MAKGSKLDPQGIIRTVDTETNKNLGTFGAEDLDQSDYLEVTGNGSSRQITITAQNDGETPTQIPLVISGNAMSVENHTASDTLTVGESGTVHTTIGAGGTVTFTLPSAATGGIAYWFMVGAAQELRIDPNGTETISLPSTGVPGAAGKYLTANAIGETVLLVSDGVGSWRCFGFTGTWTAEA